MSLPLPKNPTHYLSRLIQLNRDRHLRVAKEAETELAALTAKVERLHGLVAEMVRLLSVTMDAEKRINLLTRARAELEAK